MKAAFTGIDRKKLAEAVGSATGQDVKYLSVPTFAYKTGDYTIGRDSSLTGPDSQNLLTELHDMGFDPEKVTMEEGTAELTDLLNDKAAEMPEPDTPAEGNEEQIEQEVSNAGDIPPISNVRITVPRDKLTDDQLENLKKIIEAKGSLIRKSLGTENLDIEVTDEEITFPWLNSPRTAEEANACTVFVGKLIEFAHTHQRVTAKPKEEENEKYAFRCFLLRLGMVGSDYKVTRKVLLKNLPGNGAFKSGHKKEELENE